MNSRRRRLGHRIVLGLFIASQLIGDVATAQTVPPAPPDRPGTTLDPSNPNHRSAAPVTGTPGTLPGQRVDGPLTGSPNSVPGDRSPFSPFPGATAPASRGGSAGGSGILPIPLSRALPPDPSTVAPPLPKNAVSLPAVRSEFLYTGSNPVQTGVSPGTIVEVRAAVVRGSVLNLDGSPLPGVAISVKDHPEYGQTLSRTDGRYDLAVNGGGEIVLVFQSPVHVSAQRVVSVPWRDFIVVPDVALVPRDAETPVNLAAPGMKVVQGSTVTDEDGTRRATLLFPAGTTAQLVLPGGGTSPLSSLNVSITELTVGSQSARSMPAELPPQSVYTYAMDLDLAEARAAGATRVNFSPALPYYVDNFLSFPVGTLAPLGGYDPATAKWEASPPGRVIKILAINAGLADVDSDGDNVADTLLGLSTAERTQLGTLYSAGKTLIRVEIPHFSWWDINWGWVPVNTATWPTMPPPGCG
ncbi:MAG: hypothetical protein U0821_03845 [Chloroflexota bacterium]